jgi:hypothetical protein
MLKLKISTPLIIYFVRVVMEIYAVFDLAIENLKGSVVEFLSIDDGRSAGVDRSVPEVCKHLAISIHDDSPRLSAKWLSVHVRRTSVERNELVRTISHPLTADWLGK